MLKGHTTKAYHGGVAELVCKRDGNKCVLCGFDKDLLIDHILGVKKGGKSTLANQRVLCRSCHSKITNEKPEGTLSKIGSYLRGWRLLHPNYLRNYHREWRKKNAGYFSKYSLGKHEVYMLAR